MMMNFKTILLITTVLAILTITACSDSSDQAATEQERMTEPVAETKAKTKAEIKTTNKDHLLKGYQDNLQKAKDMGEEVKKAAEKQKKAIEDATN